MGNLRNLLMGRSLPQPREDDDDNAQAGSMPAGGSGRSIDTTAIEQAAEADRAAAVSAAVKTAVADANKRWNTVMTSDAGAANPKAAARLLLTAGGAMSADEVIETLGDVVPTDPKAAEAEADKRTAANLEKDRLALAADKTANPSTGPAGGGGEGDNAERNARIERRQQRVERNNQRVGRNARREK